jgi:glycosyltransferase involved in cell wall biosynthesis
MASARPILAVTPAGSEIMKLVDEAGCGWNVPPASPEKLAGTIIQLKDNEAMLIEMGQNGRAFLERNYSRNACVHAYEKMLMNLNNQAQMRASSVGET